MTDNDIDKVLLRAGFSQEFGNKNIYHYGSGITVVVNDDGIHICDEPYDSGMELVEGTGDTFHEAIDELIKDLNKHTRALRRTYRLMCSIVDAIQEENAEENVK